MGVSLTTVWREIGTRGISRREMSLKYAYRHRRTACFVFVTSSSEGHPPTHPRVGNGKQRLERFGFKQNTSVSTTGVGIGSNDSYIRCEKLLPRLQVPTFFLRVQTVFFDRRLAFPVWGKRIETVGRRHDSKTKTREGEFLELSAYSNPLLRIPRVFEPPLPPRHCFGPEACFL